MVGIFYFEFMVSKNVFFYINGMGKGEETFALHSEKVRELCFVSEVSGNVLFDTEGEKKCLDLQREGEREF